MALALCREDAVTGWRDMLGPKNVDEAKDTAPDRYFTLPLFIILHCGQVSKFEHKKHISMMIAIHNLS